MSTYTSDGQLPVPIIREFIAAISYLQNIGFIWRLKKELVDAPPDNVIFIDWIDQRSLLGKFLKCVRRDFGDTDISPKRKLPKFYIL
jgi:hypothetical protein